MPALAQQMIAIRIFNVIFRYFFPRVTTYILALKSKKPLVKEIHTLLFMGRYKQNRVIRFMKVDVVYAKKKETDDIQQMTRKSL